MNVRKRRLSNFDRVSERFFRIIFPIPSKPDALFVNSFFSMNSILVSSRCFWGQISSVGE